MQQERIIFLLLSYKRWKRRAPYQIHETKIIKVITARNQNASGLYLLSTYFNVKDQRKFEHQNDAVYYADCLNEKCRENYISESGRRISERIKDHNGRDLKSHILRHSVESGHANVSYEDFKIIAKNFNKNHRKRKIAESLLIKEKRPTLNTHDKSVPLKLFN